MDRRPSPRLWMRVLIYPLLLALAFISPSSNAAQSSGQCVNNAFAGGTPDAITIQNQPCLPTTSLLILTTTGANLTNAPTIQVIGQTPPQGVIRADGTQIQPGDFPPAGGVVQLVNNGAKWILLPGGAGTCFAQVDAGGTSDAITIPQQGCPLNRQLLLVESTAANSSVTPTLAEGTNAPAIIINPNGTALVPGAIPGPDTFFLVTFNGTNWILLTSAGSGGGGNVVGNGIANNVAIWTGVTNLGPGLPFGLSGPSLLLETNPSGFVSNTVLSNVPSSALANTGVGAGSYALGSATPNITVNSQGQITSIASGTASGTVNSGLVNQLAYYASSGAAVSGLASCANGVYTTTAGSVPQCVTTLPSSLTAPSLIVTTAFTATGLVTNADLVNSSTTINGTPCTLGGSCSISATAASMTVGTTTVLSGVTNELLYNNSGILGNLATANNSVLVTNGSGVPSLSTTLPSGLSVPSLTVTGAFTATGLVTNADLVNPSVTVNTITCTLGSSCTITATAASMTVGTTTVLSGTTNNILYNNAGVLGNIATANNAVLITSGAGAPSLSTTLPSGLSAPSLTVTTAFTATGLVTNADLVSATTTVNGQLCTLGGSCTITTAASSMTVGTTTIISGTSNGLLYDNAGVLGNLATANNGVLVTSGAGVPSISTTLPSALTIPSPIIATITNTGTLTLPTTTGTLLESAGTNTVTGTLNVSGTFQIGGVALTLPVPVPVGGTGLATVTTNAIPYGAGTSPLSLIASANNAVLCYSAGGVPSACATLPVAAMPTITLSGAVTGSGTTAITTSYPSEAANLVLAGPTTGSAAVATFRGLVSADLTTALLTPPPIGTTTPNPIAATTLSATGTLTTNVTGSSQCLQANSAGQVSGTGQACGAASAPVNTIPILTDSSSYGSV